MGRKRAYDIKHLPAEELDKRIRIGKNTRVLKRLYFTSLYRMSVEEAAELVGVTKATGYS